MQPALLGVPLFTSPTAPGPVEGAHRHEQRARQGPATAGPLPSGLPLTRHPPGWEQWRVSPLPR